MKRVSCFAVCVFLSFLWVPLVSAAPNQSPAAQNPKQVQNSTQSGQVVRPKAGISWKEKVLKQREIQKRAAARRNALMQQAEKEKQKNVPPPAMNP
jgi:hypothetical protein